jgi:hypothetical protein
MHTVPQKLSAFLLKIFLFPPLITETTNMTALYSAFCVPVVIKPMKATEEAKNCFK